VPSTNTSPPEPLCLHRLLAEGYDPGQQLVGLGTLLGHQREQTLADLVKGRPTNDTVQ
jgi:hypothetical protein